MNWFKKICFEMQPSPQIDPKEMRKWQVMGLVRGMLEGTHRYSTKPVFYDQNIDENTGLTYGMGEQVPLSYEEFSSVIDEMIRRGFLESFTNWDGKPAFRWAENAPEYPGKEPL
ncbi:MAG: hypothetical protein ACXAC5_00070 [Promethearchaeota archaeon]|jgi:hypothetical protein